MSAAVHAELRRRFNRGAPFAVGLFAGRWNARAPVYCAIDPMDRTAHTIDAFAVNWRQWERAVYAFPPPTDKIARRVVAQVRAQQVRRAVLWFPMVRSLPWWDIIPMMCAWPLVCEGTPTLLLPPPSYTSSDSWVVNKWWTQPRHATWIGLCLSGVDDEPERVSMATALAAIRALTTRRQRLDRAAAIMMQSGVAFGRSSRRVRESLDWLCQILTSAR